MSRSRTRTPLRYCPAPPAVRSSTPQDTCSGSTRTPSVRASTWPYLPTRSCAAGSTRSPAGSRPGRRSSASRSLPARTAGWWLSAWSGLPAGGVRDAAAGAVLEVAVVRDLQLGHRAPRCGLLSSRRPVAGSCRWWCTRCCHWSRPCWLTRRWTPERCSAGSCSCPRAEPRRRPGNVRTPLTLYGVISAERAGWLVIRQLPARSWHDRRTGGQWQPTRSRSRVMIVATWACGLGRLGGV